MKSKGAKCPRSNGCEPTTAHLSCGSTPYATVYLNFALINEWPYPRIKALILDKGERREEKTEGMGEERRIKETDTDIRDI